MKNKGINENTRKELFKYKHKIYLKTDKNLSILFAIDNYTLKIQIEEGDNSTEYTRHEEQSYIMPVQKPMLTGDYISDIEHSGWGKLSLTGNENWETMRIQSNNIGYQYFQ